MPLRLLVPAEAGSLETLASLLKENPKLASMVQLEIGESGNNATAPPSPHAEPRLPRIRWSKHIKGEKRHWTVVWQGLKLRVEKDTSAAEGVVFNGYIDDGFKFRSKSVEACRERIDIMARDMVRKRG